MRPKICAVAAALSAALAAGCLVSAAPAGAAGPNGADWLTYGGDNARTGGNLTEHALNPATVGGLHEQWSVDLGSYSDTSPIVVSGVRVGLTRRTVVYAGSEHGDLVATDAITGAVLWHRNLGAENTTCTDIPDTIFGVTGSPVADPTTNRLYAVGGTGEMYALDLGTGQTVPGWPVQLFPDPGQLHVWSALTLAGGRVYAGTASYCDTLPYHGGVIAVDAQQAKVVARFYPSGSYNGGAVWAWGGVSVRGDGTVFAATGNAFGPSQHVDYAEHVVSLTPSLVPVQANYPGLVGPDVDFGSTPTLFQVPGCPAELMVENKSGVLLVYDQNAISSGPVQRIQVADVNDDEFDGMPAYDPATRMAFVSNSSDSSSGVYRHGMVAFSVGSDCQLHLAWQHVAGPSMSVVSTPTVAGGVVYYGDGTGNRVLAFDERTGRLLWDSGSSLGGPIFAAPVVAGRFLYAVSWDHRLHAFGF